MSDVLTVGAPPIEVQLRRNSRAKKLILRVGRDGPVLTVPSRLRLPAAQDFLIQNESWLRTRLAAAPAPALIEYGIDLPFEGRPLTVTKGSGRVRVDGDTLIVPQANQNLPQALAAFLKNHARRRLTKSSIAYAQELGKSVARITLRDPKTRWGSCSSTGNLMFSWRLAMAPREVLDYVAAHEVAHLVEFNHSRYFWRLVDDLCPDYPYHRAWLKENGPALHAYRFAS